jgi:transglutaminase-like putative cysteine protease
MHKASLSVAFLTVVFLTVILAGLLFTAETGSGKPAVSAPPGPGARTVAFTMRTKIATGGKNGSLTFITLVPRTIEGRQEVVSLECTPTPERIFEENGDRFAEFELVEPADHCEIRVRSVVKLFSADLGTARKDPKRRKVKRPEPETLTAWLKAEPCIEVEDPAIRALARKVTGRDPVRKVRKIHDLVVKTLAPGPHRAANDGAVKALAARKGDVTDYTDLFVALCRAAGIPARYVEGYTVPYADGPEYAWPAVYFQKYGWVCFDPMGADFKAASFERIQNRFVTLTEHRHLETLEGDRYWKHHYSGESMTLKTDLIVHRNPETGRAPRKKDRNP